MKTFDLLTEVTVQWENFQVRSDEIDVHTVTEIGGNCLSEPAKRSDLIGILEFKTIKIIKLMNK